MNTVNLIVSSSAGETWLDLYDEQPIKLTFNLEDATSLEPKAEFTRGFRVPGTDKNYEFFSTVFEVSGVDFNPGQKYSCRININGNDFRQGELRLQNVLRNDVTGKLDYQCVFLGNVKSLASEVGEKHIGQLDWSDWTQTIDLAMVTGSWEASFANDDGIFDGDVVFPLCDYGNVYDGSTPQVPEVSVGGTKSFTSSGNALPVSYWRPMVRIREIMRRIFEQNGFTLAGNFFTENQGIKNLYLSAFGNKEDVEVEEFDGNLATWRPANAAILADEAGLSITPFNIIVADPGLNLSLTGQLGQQYYQYTVPSTVGGFGTIDYKIYIPLRLTHREQTSAQYTFRGLRPDFTAFSYYRFTVGPGQGNCAGQASQFLVEESVNGTAWVTLDERCGTEADGFEDGEGFTYDYYVYEFPFEMENTGQATAAGQTIIPPQLSVGAGSDTGNILELLGGAYMEITRVAGGFSIGEKFRKDYKVIDFIKDIFTMFRLLMIPDPENPTTIRVIPWNDYIGTGVVKDWSNKLNKDKDVVIRPLLLDQTDRFTLEQAIDGDWLNQENNKQQQETYGTKKLDSVYDILKGETKITTKLAATPATTIRGANSSYWRFFIPHLYSYEAEEDFVKYNPMVPKSRLLVWNGMKNIGNSESWFAEDNDASTTEFTQAPIASVFTQMPNGGPNNFSYTFERETSFDFDNNILQVNGQDLFSRYWSKYLELVYNKDARRVTAYFTLDADDILNFKYNDVIFVEGIYYYVEKIYDAPLGESGKVKVDLITLKFYRPTVTLPPVVDELEWQEGDEDWEDVDQFWNNI